MIKFPRLFFRKIILGIVLILLAALVTLFIKDNLDTKDPTSALPDIIVKYNGAVIDPAYPIRAAYSWNFLTTIETSPVLGVEDVPLSPFSALPFKEFIISFSKAPEKIVVSRAEGRNSVDFTEVISEKPGVLTTPSLAGYYVYKIEANWGMRGSILYFLAVQVRSD